MKNLFEPATVEEVKQRMAQLRPDSERQWGKMNVAQMVAHCSWGHGVGGRGQDSAADVCGADTWGNREADGCSGMTNRCAGIRRRRRT